MPHVCKAIGCSQPISSGEDFCLPCGSRERGSPDSGRALAERYPNQYRSIEDLTEIDVFGVHHLFQLQDPSGCLQHASRKLLLSGSTGLNAIFYNDIREARDTLTRWLQLNQGLNAA